MKCHLCDQPALAIFYFNEGCICNPDMLQGLCFHHAQRSLPIDGGYKEFLVDLTIDCEFTTYWDRLCYPMLYRLLALRSIG